MSLTVAPNTDGEATGYLYLDDGATFGYTKGEFTVLRFDYKGHVLTMKVLGAGYKAASGFFNKIVILGINNKPSKARFVIDKEKREVEIEELDYDASIAALFVLLVDGQAKVLEEFTMTLEI